MNSARLVLFFATVFVLISTYTGCVKNYINPVVIVDSLPHDSIPYIDSTLYTVTGSGKDSGDILLAINTKNSSDGFLLVLNKDGYVKKKMEIGARADNFQRWNFNGKTFYSYLIAEGDYAIGGQGTEEGYDVICDSNLIELWRANKPQDRSNHVAAWRKAQ